MENIDAFIETSKDLTLLYVEDDLDAQEMTSMILEDFFGNVLLASNGEEGFQKFQDNHIDIIITDINIPKLHGIDLITKIRELDEEIPIVVISAHNEVNFFQETIKLGVNGYLLKPIEIEQLTHLLRELTEKYIYIKEAKENFHLLEMYKIATNASSIVSKTDPKGIITFVNDTFCEISGYTRKELIGKNHNIVRHPDNPKKIFQEIWKTIKDEKKIWKGIVRNKKKNGKSYYVDSTIVPILDLQGNILEYISLRHDITDIMNPMRQLTSALKNFQSPILIYIKLDKFTILEEFYDNDTIELIQEKAWKYLEKQFSTFYEFDKLYTLGNGEAALLIDHTKYFNDNFILNLKRLQSKIKDDNIQIDDIEYDIAIIISLVYEKNKMLESAKLGIRNLLKTNRTFLVANNLSIVKQKQAQENMQIVAMIKSAIEDSRIISYFQPIVDNQTKKIVKYESLVRLLDDNGKVVSPYFFIETSKKSNHYFKITNIVLEHSFSMLHHLNTDISINLSAIDIEQKITRKKIFQLLKEYKKETHRIIFELLEDESIRDFSIMKHFIHAVKKYNVKIAIDDFGAGYSNYERLLDYQPDILKIDGCLIKDIETNHYSRSAVKSIVTFAKEQNIQTVAEFIENETIFKIIKELGIDYSQGYYFGKPGPLTC